MTRESPGTPASGAPNPATPVKAGASLASSASKNSKQQDASSSPGPSRSVTTGKQKAAVDLNNKGLQIEDGTDNEEGKASASDSQVPNESNRHDLNDLRYHIRSEVHPDGPIYDEQLKAVLRQTKQQLSAMQRTMEQCPLVTDGASSLYNLAKQTEDLAQFKYPVTRTIGVVGESGVGKSSLLNSLLDVKRLARLSGNGMAVTNIVTEYCYTDSTEYRFIVEYMSSEEVTELLEELLQSYRAHFTEAFKEVKDLYERKRIKRIAERAEETFNSVFGNIAGFSLDMLAAEGADADVTALNYLKAMAKSVRSQRPGGLEMPTYVCVAQTIEDLAKELRGFTCDSAKSDVPTIWPFVRIIRVYLSSEVLSTGLIFADLPGLRDLNYARVRATERYMRRCDGVFAVTNMNRAVDGEALDDIISRCGKDKPICIICTHSENVDADDTIEDDRSPSVAREVKRMKEEKDKLQKRFAELTKKRHQENGEVGLKASTEEHEARDELETMKFTLKKYLVEHRNNFIKADIRAKLSRKAMNNEPKIFCVSNKDWETYRYSEVEKSVADRHLLLSGVVDLKRYCQTIPAEAQFKAVASFLQGRVPALATSVSQWLLKGSVDLEAERAEKLRKVLGKVQDDFDAWSQVLSTLRDNLRSDFRNNVLSRMDDLDEDWSQQAIDSGDDWSTLHWATYKACCNRDGRYTDSHGTSHNWNETLILPVRRELGDDWEKTNNVARHLVRKAVSQIDDIFERGSKVLEANLDLERRTLGNLIWSLTLRKRNIGDRVEVILSDFLGSTRSIRFDALFSHDSSDIAGIMHRVYKLCQKPYGTGSASVRVAYMENHLARRDMFAKLRGFMEVEQRKAIDKAVDEMETVMATEFDALSTDIQNVAGTEGELSESRRFSKEAAKIKESVEELNQLGAEVGRVLEHLQSLRERSELSGDADT
ncbi:hypothetical protein K469DRAFT_681465 [Zopfia rhizophila CBS 207.26]|uniref:G domain-containing protein n=1 Tax=Zopfia rhizophila CBS 207.26 TaxID=1314779 RepID=A0A6A6EY88_9PEZI|nr:hypothetical protein K469DRAFT_681465 [Zopfia rhizophila CBS 207.26]